ncbi:MAG: ankyrin repeat domain-containing protein [Alphaproteobacteria bacterium]|nr:ankyrin repeat domain-containing protein [Alphaproteobacteria bacterium]
MAVACSSSVARADEPAYSPRPGWLAIDEMVFDHASRQDDPGADTGVVLGALSTGYRIDLARDALGRTPIMVAATTGNDEFVQVALSGAATNAAGGPLDISLVDDRGWTALDHARAAGNDHIVSLLVEGAQPAGTPPRPLAMASLAPAAQPVSPATMAPEPDPHGRSGPLGVALWSPLAVGQSKNKDHIGISLAVLYGSHLSLRGVQLGTIAHTRHGGFGLQSGLFTWTGGPFYGVQVGGFHFSGGTAAGRTAGCYGICVGAANLHGGGMGLHAGVMNGVTSADGILQLGVANYGVHRLRGAMFGLVNHVTHDFDGLQVGFHNWNSFMMEQTVTDLGAGMQKVETTTSTWQGRSRGVQIGFDNTSDRLDGAQIGVSNMSRRQVRGVQLGAVNLSGLADERPSSGLQLGGINGARDFGGVQLGLINIARELHGVQIGGLNIAWKNKLPMMVLVNAG